jgi:predicted nucleic acid-binding protein
VIGVDTSYLVGLAVREHAAHGRCWSLFEAEIAGGTATMAVAPQVLAEFCHVVTDPRRFERPLDMPAALELCEQWWNAQECRPVALDAEVGSLFLTWMHELRLGRKQLLDTLLAACYHRAGVRRLATSNWRDFARYGVFQIESLE